MSENEEQQPPRSVQLPAPALGFSHAQILSVESGIIHFQLADADGNARAEVNTAPLSGEDADADVAASILAGLTPSLSARRTALRLRAKQRRREVEAAGVIVDGAPLETDRATTGDLTKTLMLGSIIGESFAVDWKFADGVFRHRTLAQLQQMALAAGAYVQTCFSRESQLLAAIAAAETAEQLAAVAAEIEAFEHPS
ncbi:MAG: DUF4376 domain-containing protein [Candidatus Didemnitutus sp.]|nr:DUF4376 domain-containing protein [Candidatus Didemnitutus sp.]